MQTFSESVIKLALSIPKGRVTTYGRITKAAGAGPMASQSVTGILWKAQKEKGYKIPWHRIVYANGKVWINPEHRVKRLKLYKQEGIQIEKDKIKDFNKVLLEFK